MFTRRHYIEVAKILKNGKENYGYGNPDVSEKTRVLEVLKWDFIKLFRNDNPNFDELKFSRACDILQIGE